MSLPNSFQYKKVDDQTYRANLLNEGDIKKWFKNYMDITSTSWILKKFKNNTSHFVSSYEYYCHHTGYKRINAAANKKGKSKNCNCKARIKVCIKVTTKNTIRKDKYVKDGMPAIIFISNKHNHNITSAESLSYLHTTKEVRQKFEEYFESGLGIKEACNYHELKLELALGPESAELANAQINPKYRSVQFWYDNWRSKNLGPRSGDGVLQKLEEKQELYQSKGIIVKYSENPFAILVITKLMQRAHSLPFSKDVAFVDSTSSCDALNHALTFVLTPCHIGAVPLAVIITAGQSIRDYQAGFQLLKDTVSNAFCGEGFPKLFITDDSESERCALKVVWPCSKTLLCRFHVCQSVWRWLWEKKHNIPQNLRKNFYKDFQNILVASTVNKAMEAFNSAILNANSMSRWQKYLQDYWTKKEDWCLAYRNSTTHGHQTNNFSEISVRLFKDIVLSRNKAYNAVALVDFCCTAMEEYYLRRIRNFIYQRDVTCRLLLKRYIDKTKYLKKNDIQQLSSELFCVPSEKTNEMYDVDVSSGVCSCPVGNLGSFCKHQAAVLHHFQTVSVNAPSYNTESRCLMAQLAFGKKVQPINFYMPFTNQQSSENVHEMSEFSNNLASTSKDKQPKYHALEVPLPDTSSLPNIEQIVSDHSFALLVNVMKESNTKFGTSTQSYKRFIARLKSIKTRNGWESFLNTTGSNSSLRFKRKSTINVQPTSIARRRLGIIKGCKRAPVGRLARSEYSNKRTKRRHNLAKNVEANLPNAIKHGTSH